MSVNALSVSPLAAGLFHKIIAESGAMVIPGGFGGNMNLEDAEARGLVFQDSAHVNSLAELRQIPAEDIMKIRAGTGSIITDGYVLPESIADVYAAGKQSQVPLLTGWNLDDALFAMPVNLAGYRSNIAKQYW
jgi:para-nitrobenzyl esterase